MLNKNFFSEIQIWRKENLNFKRYFTIRKLPTKKLRVKINKNAILLECFSKEGLR
jgi:hypothetical protein